MSCEKECKLRSPNKIQEMGTTIVVSISGGTDGHWYRSFVVVGGFALSGLNVNNNNYDNDNIGVAGLRKF